MPRRILLASTALFLAAVAYAETITGRVVGISDGDTLTLVTDEKKQLKIRLYGIDAPESKQPFGQRAKLALSELAFGKEARADIVNTDRYGRSVAWVFVGETNVNEAQVAAGLAWWYRSYAKRSVDTLGKLEAEARAAKRGVWSEPQPVAPWDWRSRGRERDLR